MVEIVEFTTKASLASFQFLGFILKRAQLVAGVVDQSLVGAGHFRGGIQGDVFLPALHLREPFGGLSRSRQIEVFGEPQPLLPVLRALVEKLLGGFFDLA